MKKTIFKQGSRIFLVSLVGLLVLGSCRKSGKIAEVAHMQFVGDWKLSDLMLVNAGDKPPRKLEELPRLNDLRFIMAPDGKLSAGGNEKGSWAVIKDSISFRFDGEESLDLKVSRIESDFMLLEYGYDANDGTHGGTIYYAFVK